MCIRDSPDLDDDFAQTASQFDTLDELRTGLTDRVTRGKRCLLYTSDAADERSSVDLGGRRIIKKKK